MCICFPYSHSVLQIERQRRKKEGKNERNNGEIDKGKEKTLTMLPIAHPLK